MFSGISLWQLLIVLAIVVLLFGTKKLRGMGGDLGGALKGFKKAMKDDEETDKQPTDTLEPPAAPNSPVSTHKTTNKIDQP